MGRVVVFLSLAYFTKHRDFSLRPFSYRYHDFFMATSAMTMYPLFFTHSSVREHPDSCYFPASVSSAMINSGVQVSLGCFNLESFREIPGNAMTGLYSTEFCFFFFFPLEDICVDFHCGYAGVQSQEP